MVPWLDHSQEGVRQHLGTSTLMQEVLRTMSCQSLVAALPQFADFLLTPPRKHFQVTDQRPLAIGFRPFSK